MVKVQAAGSDGWDQADQAVGMEKSEFGHDLGPGVVRKRESPSCLRFLMTSVLNRLCLRCLGDIQVGISSG